MIVIDEILTAVNTAMDLAKKHQDKETAEKLIEIYSSILDVKKENEELKKKLKPWKQAIIMKIWSCVKKDFIIRCPR